MEKKDFHRTITVNASTEEAMKKISQVNKWWAKKVEGKTEKLNDKFTVDFGETFVDFQISDPIADHWHSAAKQPKGALVFATLLIANRLH
jgi:hypothetical protein